MVPGLGDDIQAIKAGILEIADIFVVNKADREGADRTSRELSMMLEMGNRKDGEWLPKVLKTEASRGVGIDELVSEFEEHRRWLFGSGTINRFMGEKNIAVFSEMLKDRLFRIVYDRLAESGELESIVSGMGTRSVDPYSAVEKILHSSLASTLTEA
jgi:LAO/AO transport system kinase